MWTIVPRRFFCSQTVMQFLHFVQLSLNSGLENWDTKGWDIKQIDKGQISTYRNKPQSSSLI